MTHSNLPVVDIRNLHKSYGDLEILKGAGVRAFKGDVVSLIGSSGSGKSTLLRCLNLLENSQQGDILFDSEAIKWRGTGPSRMPCDKAQIIRVLTNLSMVIQQFNLWATCRFFKTSQKHPLLFLVKTDG